MKKYILIGAGGFLGAVGRYYIREVMSSGSGVQLPVGTLIINAAGAFFLAFVLSEAFEIWNIGADLRLGISAGLLGALTTFSTLCKETAGFIMTGDMTNAAVYLALSVLLGTFAAYCGSLLAHGLAVLKRSGRSGAETTGVVDIESEAD